MQRGSEHLRAIYQSEKDSSVAEVYWKKGFFETTFYHWKKIRRLRSVEINLAAAGGGKNKQLKQLVVNLS